MRRPTCAQAVQALNKGLGAYSIKSLVQKQECGAPLVIAAQLLKRTTRKESSSLTAGELANTL
ncbi:MAG: hypothetical protein L0Z46_07600 [Nitrospiraceae bacterium]|nr:hypothetical protein [Nitrospiraceae bacterium]